MFEGGAAAVEFQLDAARKLVGGKRAGDEIWDEVRARTADRRCRATIRSSGSLHERIRAAAGRSVIDRELIDACTHCGFCLPTCPTYGPLGQMEADSPRGRIWLMKGLADGTMTVNSAVVEHIDRCLGCMACVTACPSGVRYDLLIEQTREVVEEQYERPAGDWLLRTLVFSVFPHRRRLRACPRARAAGRRCCPGAYGRLAISRRPGARASGRPRGRPRRCSARPGRAAHRLRAERRLRRRERRPRPGCWRQRATRSSRRRSRPAAARSISMRAGARRESGWRAPLPSASPASTRSPSTPPAAAPTSRTRASTCASPTSPSYSRRSREQSGIRSTFASPSRTRATSPTRRGSASSRATSSTRSPASNASSRPSRRSAAAPRASTTSRSRTRRASSATARRSTCSPPSRTPTRARTPAASCRSRPRYAVPGRPLPALHPIELVDASIRGVNADELLATARR